MFGKAQTYVLNQTISTTMSTQDESIQRQATSKKIHMNFKFHDDSKKST